MFQYRECYSSDDTYYFTAQGKLIKEELNRSSSSTESLSLSATRELLDHFKVLVLIHYCGCHFSLQFTVAQIKDEMEKTLQWLVPIATNTAK